MCKLDENQVCIGCKRTIKEIAVWSTMSDKEKNDVLNRIKNCE